MIQRLLLHVCQRSWDMTSHTEQACHLIRGFQDFVEPNEEGLHGISAAVTRLKIQTAVCL